MADVSAIQDMRIPPANITLLSDNQAAIRAFNLEKLNSETVSRYHAQDSRHVGTET